VYGGSQNLQLTTSSISLNASDNSRIFQTRHRANGNPGEEIDRQPYNGVEERLRLADRLAKIISDHEGLRVVQAWFTGLNPELNDCVPVWLLREENIEAVGSEVLGGG
jgi:hypothetical protein